MVIRRKLTWFVYTTRHNTISKATLQEVGAAKGKLARYYTEASRTNRPYYAQQKTDEAGAENVEVAPFRPFISEDEG